MIVNDRIHRRAEIVLPRGRSGREVWLEADVAVRVAECGDDGAPVAARVADTRSGTRIRLDLRVRDGILWRASGSDGRRRNPVEDVLRGMIADRLKELESFCHGRERGADGWVRPWGRGERISEIDGIRPSAVLRDALPDLERVLQSWADREVLLVGGVVHVRARSPRLTLDRILPKHLLEILPDRTRRTFPERGVLEWIDGDEQRTAALGSVLEWLESRARISSPKIRDAVAAVRRRLDASAPEVLRSDLLASARARSTRNVDLVGGWGGLPNLSGEAERKFRSALILAASDAEEAGGSLEGTFDLLDDLRGLGRRAVFGQVPRAGVCDPAPEGDGRTATLALPFVRSRDDGWYGGTDAGPAEIDVEIPLVDPATIRTAFLTRGGKREVLRGGNGWFMTMDRDMSAARLDRNGPGWLLSLPRRDALVEARRFATDAMVLSGRDRDPSAFMALEHSMMPDDVWSVRARRADGRREAVLADFARHRLVADGTRLLLRIPEPTVALRDEGPAGWRLCLDVSWRHGMPGLVEGRRTDPRFRLDEADEAAELFATIRTHRQPIDGPLVDPVDLSDLGFDSAAWNLKAAFLGILGSTDGRMETLPSDTVLLAARVRRSMERAAGPDWTALVAGDPGGGPASDVLRILAHLDVPFFDDMGPAVLKAVARRAAAAILERAREKEPEPDDGWAEGFAL